MIKPSFLGTFVLVSISMAVIFTVDTFLAAAEHSESVAGAARLYSQGQSLVAQGDYTGAIDRFQDAISLDRTNREYQRALADAQLRAGKTSDAEATLSDFLQSEPTDGMASLLMSRVMLKQGRVPEAISYLHRAIYGDWSQDPAGNRLRARFELIDLLASRHSKEELLSELMAIQDHLPPDQEMKRGSLFLQAGSPSRAADVFRAVLQEDPKNAEAENGLGEAEFARGDYRAAQHDFQTALRLAPGNQEAQQHLELSNEVLELDPTIRGLGPAERLRRSRKVLEMTVDAITRCAGPNPAAELQSLLDEANTAMTPKRSAAKPGDAESNLDLAEQIWQERKKICQAAPAEGGALPLVLARIAQ